MPATARMQHIKDTATRAPAAARARHRFGARRRLLLVNAPPLLRRLCCLRLAAAAAVCCCSCCRRTAAAAAAAAFFARATPAAAAAATTAAAAKEARERGQLDASGWAGRRRRVADRGIVQVLELGRRQLQMGGIEA